VSMNETLVSAFLALTVATISIGASRRSGGGMARTSTWVLSWSGAMVKAVSVRVQSEGALLMVAVTAYLASTVSSGNWMPLPSPSEAGVMFAAGVVLLVRTTVQVHFGP